MNPVFGQAAELLHGWIYGGKLSSRVDHYIASVTGAGSHYQHLLHSQDEAAARKFLDAMHGPARRHRIAWGITSIATGMLDLLRADFPNRQNNPVHILTIGQLSLYPLPHGISDKARMVHMENPGLPGKLSREPYGNHVCNRDTGTLGLMSVALLVDPDQSDLTELALTLPARGKTDGPHSFVIVKFSLDGKLSAYKYLPELFEHGPRRATFGIIPQTDVWGNYRYGEAHAEEKIGFPDGPAFVSDNLELIGRYYSDLASQLPLTGPTRPTQKR